MPWYRPTVSWVQAQAGGCQWSRIISGSAMLTYRDIHRTLDRVLEEFVYPGTMIFLSAVFLAGHAHEMKSGWLLLTQTGPFHETTFDIAFSHSWHQNSTGRKSNSAHPLTQQPDRRIRAMGHQERYSHTDSRRLDGKLIFRFILKSIPSY